MQALRQTAKYKMGKDMREEALDDEIICPIIQSKEKMKKDEQFWLIQMSEEEQIKYETEKLRAEEARRKLNFKLKKAQNQILVNLMSGFDMPLDPLKAFEVMPSVFCEVSYGLGQESSEQLVSRRSSIKTSCRNPVWNEQLVLPMLDEYLGLDQEYDIEGNPLKKDQQSPLIYEEGKF